MWHLRAAVETYYIRHLEQVDPVISIESSCSLVVFGQSGQVQYLTDEIILTILLIDGLEL